MWPKRNWKMFAEKIVSCLQEPRSRGPNDTRPTTNNAFPEQKQKQE